MKATQRAALRSLVRRLLPELGREVLLELLARRIAGESPHPALEALEAEPEMLGWAHQYCLEEAKEQVFARLLKHGQKVRSYEIPVATQLFTPAWIVRFLVENSLGRLWREMHPDSALELPYLIPGERVSPPVRLAREIRVLDPACGAMHFGLAVYDLLVRCYQEELSRAGEPGWPEIPSVAAESEIPAAIMALNLYGSDIDPEVLAVARTALRLKTGVEPVHLHLLPPPLGALDRGQGPEDLFHVILTNPPYLARKHAEPDLAAYLETHYPEAKGDLYTAFLQRCTERLTDGGRVAMLTQSSFMFINSYGGFRRHLLGRVAIETVAHFGSGALAEIAGEKVNTAGFVFRREADPARRELACGAYIRLVDGGEAEKLRALADSLRSGRVFRVPQDDFQGVDGAPWIYWLPSELRIRFGRGERLGDRARFCRGITTADNNRFVRYWWEVGLEAVDFGCRSAAEAEASASRWFPYMKGGAATRWFGNILHVLDWAQGGRELRSSRRAAVRNLPYQFRKGVTYSSVTGGSLTARWMDPGFLFDQASNALFPHDPADLPVLLALLNHPVAGYAAGFNPTVNIVAADLVRIPWPQVDREEVGRIVAECVGLARRIDQLNELSPFFRQPPLPDRSDLLALAGQLAQCEASLEELIDQGLGLTSEGRAAIRRGRREIAPPLPAAEALREPWTSYALGALLGRCRPGGYGGGELLQEHWSEIAPLVRESLPLAEATAAVRQVLEILLGPGAPAPLEPSQFLARHGRTYRRRPVFVLRNGLLEQKNPHP